MAETQETKIEEELACPLCDYSLRGLVEPRCPECGYQFDWEGLRAALKHRHVYLFEHGRGVSVGRAVRTFVHGLRPRKFWGAIDLAHEIRPRRLAVYWGIVAVVIVIGMIALPFGNVIFQRAQQTMQLRKTLAVSLNNPQFAGQRQQLLKQFGSMQAVVDAYAPSIWSGRFWRTIPSIIQWRGVGRGYGESLEIMIYAAAFAALWPWLTLGLLGIFVQSRSRAKIRWAQLMRCVVYCGDVAVFSGVLACMLVMFQREFDRRFQGVIPGAMLVIAFVALAAGYRLSVSFSRYLRMQHAWMVVLSTQVIGVLVLLIVAPHEAADWVIRLIAGL